MFWGALPADWKSESLAYTSAPLASDMLVYGSGSADLWVTATGGDADIQVTITEVRPDGQETYVQRGWLRLSNRTLDDARSTPLLPIHLEQPLQLVPLLPGRPVLARVEINKMGHYFRKGSRLRLWIDTPAQTGGLVFDTFTQKQQIHVLHNARYDSLIRIGVLTGVHGPDAYPACGTVLMQPCRPDPLGGT
jgi:predicted acyl esterase